MIIMLVWVKSELVDVTNFHNFIAVNMRKWDLRGSMKPTRKYNKIKYFKSDKTLCDYGIPLLLAAVESGVEHQKMMWECRGKCHKAGMSEHPVTEHACFMYPSGTIWIICMKCGASCFYYDMEEANSTLVNILPDVKQATAEHIEKVRKLVMNKRKLDKEYYARKKQEKENESR
jgi:hypothetical protein